MNQFGEQKMRNKTSRKGVTSNNTREMAHKQLQWEPDSEYRQSTSLTLSTKLR